MLHALHPFEAVLFDLDGTLVATDRFWPDAARAGALKAFAAEGLQRELPSTEQWMSLVGLPLEQGFDALFADLDPVVRARVLQACVEEEHRLLAEGRAGLLPGVAETLAALAESGLAIGVASNCSQGYLDAMWQGTELRRWVRAARCLHSPGIRDKADMVEELLIEFGTRRALMVGDREGDRGSAWANGLPHVHLTRGYAQPGERVVAEAVLAGMDELLPRLERRSRWIDEALAALALGDRGMLGVLGAPGSDHEWVAQDLARVLEAQGVPVQRTSSEASLRWTAAGGLEHGQPSAAHAHLFSQDSEGVACRLLGAEETLGALAAGQPAGWTIVHGPLLHQPEALQHLDRVLVVEVSPEVAQRRRQGCLRALPRAERDQQAERWGILDRLERDLQDRYPPAAIAHAVLDGNNALGPTPRGVEGASSA